MLARQSGNRLCIFQVNTEIFQNTTTNHNTIIIEHTTQEFNLPTLIHYGAKLYPLYQRGLRLRVYVYKGLYISLLKNKYCISYYTAIIVELVFPVNYFVYHIEIHLVVTLLGTSPFRIPANAFQYGVG
jgi:hypothetical protein